MKKTKLFSLTFTVGRLDKLVKILIRSGKNKTSTLLVPATMNEIVLASHTPSLHALLAKTPLLTPDGMPIVWLARRQGTYTERLYGPDIMVRTLERGQTAQLRHFLYGSTPSGLARLKKKLAHQFPKAHIVGTLAPPFRELTAKEKQATINAIQKSGAHIVWVGLGGEKQIRWLHEFAPHLPHHVLAAVGAAFDFLSGQKRQAPRWLRAAGLEWCFRLIQEPRRLTARYIVHLPTALWLYVQEIKKLYGAKKLS